MHFMSNLCADCNDHPAKVYIENPIQYKCMGSLTTTVTMDYCDHKHRAPSRARCVTWWILATGMTVAGIMAVVSAIGWGFCAYQQYCPDPECPDLRDDGPEHFSSSCYRWYTRCGDSHIRHCSIYDVWRFIFVASLTTTFTTFGLLMCLIRFRVLSEYDSFL